MITTPDQVDDLAARARDAGRMALDVEFLWERTYAPIPCLAQGRGALPLEYFSGETAQSRG